VPYTYQPRACRTYHVPWYTSGEEYFVTALNELIDVNGISPDVAGATFMAAGSSSPEVFAALIGLFFSSSEGGGAGVGTVVGSAVFNVLVIIGGAALYSDRGITLEWRTLLRDAGFYAASLVALYVCFDDGVLSAAEAACMVGLYFVYLVVCAFFGRVVGCLCPEKKKLTGKAQSSSSGTTAYQDLEKENRITGFALGDDRAAADMVRALMVRMEKDRYVLFKEARRAIVAPYFGTHNASKNMASDMAHATMQERATLRKAFDVFDHSKTGVINPGDISGMLAHLGVDADSELVADLWAVLDSAKDNKVTFDEFAPVYANWHRYGLRQAQKLMLKPEELQKVRAVFDRLDVSRSGWLSQAEMDAAFEQLLGTEEGAGLVDRLMVVRMFKHAGGDRHEMTFDAFKALYVQWFGYSGALYDADTAKLGAAQGEHVPNASAAAVVAEHGEHALLQWPSTTGARLNYVAGFPFALLFHFTVPNCAVARWRAYYPLTMLASIAWLGALVFFMISWAEKAGCMLGISETLLGLTVCAIGTSGPDAIASLIVAKEGNGVMAVSNAFGSNVFDILFGLGFPFLLKTLITGNPRPNPNPDTRTRTRTLTLTLTLPLTLTLTLTRRGLCRLDRGPYRVHLHHVRLPLPLPRHLHGLEARRLAFAGQPLPRHLRRLPRIHHRH